MTDSANLTATGKISVAINSPPRITTQSPIFGGTLGVAYVQTFQATGGNPPYTWKVASGDTGGLTLGAATGDLTGTPQATGTFNFTIQVTDQSGATASQAFSLVVSQPTLTITAAGSLPAATAGVSYSQKVPVVASGGTAPYTWSVIAGAVPGLSLDSASLTLSGTPSTPGSFNFTIQATDAANLTATRSLPV